MRAACWNTGRTFDINAPLLLRARYHRNHATSECPLLADSVYHGIPEFFRVRHGQDTVKYYFPDSEFVMVFSCAF